jgi:riboflavin synthase
MFTGIIQAVGQIAHITPMGDDVKLSIEASNLGLNDVQLGDSIAVNGVCLTVTALTPQSFEVHVSKETLSCTVGLDSVKAVNLEKALRYSDRLGGHLVSGHVDGIGQIVKFDAVGDCWLLVVRAPHALMRYIAVKGSIAIDGVSLTINALEKDTFSLNLIPHTIDHTTFKQAGVGSRVNLEIDLVARYLQRMTEWDKEQQGDSA